jgi:hypothetical protein
MLIIPSSWGFPTGPVRHHLDRYKLKLNPTKCSFGVPAGQLLGLLVSARGIEPNSEKIQAILTMAKPTKLNEIQQLAG